MIPSGLERLFFISAVEDNKYYETQDSLRKIICEYSSDLVFIAQKERVRNMHDMQYTLGTLRKHICNIRTQCDVDLYLQQYLVSS